LYSFFSKKESFEKKRKRRKKRREKNMVTSEGIEPPFFGTGIRRVTIAPRDLIFGFLCLVQCFSEGKEKMERKRKRGK
jgi:hypothetical protein